MALSTSVFAILFALLAGSGSAFAQSPGPTPAASPAQRSPPTWTANSPSSRLGPTLPPRISPLPPMGKSHSPALTPIAASPPAPPTAPVTSPATSIIPPAAIANPPELNPPSPSTPGNGAASNSVGCRVCLAAVLFAVAVTM